MASSLVPFPADHVSLGRGILEPKFTTDGAALVFALQDGPSCAIARWDCQTHLLESLTTTPDPSAGVLYGGGLFDVAGDTLVYATRAGRLHRQHLGTGDVAPMTPPFAGVGAPVLSPCGRFVAFVADDGSRASVYVADLDGAELHRMPGCLPFCADPVFGPDGAYLAFQTWGGDVMPWCHSELRVVSFRVPLRDCKHIYEALPATFAAVASPGVHVAFPLPHPDGEALLFVSDESGARTPWTLDLRSFSRRALGPFDGEVGTPNWVQRMMPMALTPDASELVSIVRNQGVASLVALDMRSGTSHKLDVESTSISALCVDPSGRGDIAYVGSSPVCRPALHLLQRASTPSARTCVSGAVGSWSADRLVRPEVVRWSGGEGLEISGILTCAAGSTPSPLIVLIHGGPTSSAELGWDPMAQFLATRGYACLSVNHRGSTQRGRAFQDLLAGQWGHVDVEDARTGALAMVDRGIADRGQLAIMGASSGGFTALMCLAMQPDLWAAGISLYGIGELYDAAAGTHRFEQPYQQWLVGKLPEAAARWRSRSPLHHASRVRAPVLLFHGTDDKAVPCQQSVDFAAAVTRSGGVAQLVTYQGEGHGFRQPANRRDMLDRIQAFLDKYVRCAQGTPADPPGAR